jgi:hypothetical protein
MKANNMTMVNRKILQPNDVSIALRNQDQKSILFTSLSLMSSINLLEHYHQISICILI